MARPFFRIACAGASRTGKTTLAEFLSAELQIPMNPIGSRSVAQAMGFESPYEVDRAGKRAEFQKRLLTGKQQWEAEHDEFVTDRSTADNLAYTALHEVRSIDLDTLHTAAEGMDRYTHLFRFSMRTFWKPGSDIARNADWAYSRIYECCLFGLLDQLRGSELSILHVPYSDIGKRQTFALQQLGQPRRPSPI